MNDTLSAPAATPECPSSAEGSAKVALVTGAGQRIGLALALALHDRGFKVILHYRRDGSAAIETAAELNRERADSAAALQADLTDMEAVARLAREAGARWGRLDALVNNASSYYPTAWGEATERDWDTLFGSNLKGPFFLTQALLPALAADRGCVVNLIDIFAERPAAGFPVYCMAKAGLAMLTRSLALEWGDRIRVNGIAPGVILWPETEPDAATQQAMLDRIPQGRIGDPDDIVRTALFLISEASYVNGQIIAVDGGYSLNQ